MQQIPLYDPKGMKKSGEDLGRQQGLRRFQ